MIDTNNISLDNNQKTDWNSFQDHLADDYPTSSALNDFNNKNKKSTLTPDHIPIAINEVAAIKANPYVDGLNPSYKNGSNFRYPVTADGKHLNVGNDPTSIPKPDFSDAAATQNYRNKLYKKYGEYVKDNADLPEELNSVVGDEKSSLGDITKNAASKLGVSPSILYSSAMQEGMRGLIPNEKNKGQTDYSGDKDYPISGYTNFGLDRFSDMVPELKKKGYLPSDFEQNYKKSVETLPKTESGAGDKVNSANFKSIDSAMQAKAAVLKNTYDHLDDIAKEAKIPLSSKARDFFALVAYNAGEGNAKKMLKSYAQKGYLKDDAFIDKQPDSSWSGPYKNVIQRIKGAQLLDGEGYF